MTTRYTKTTVEILDYTIDWTRVLTADSDTLASDSWAVTEGGVTITLEATSGSASIVWLSGGTAATASRVVCTMVSTAGRTYQRGIWLDVVAAGKL